MCAGEPGCGRPCPSIPACAGEPLPLTSLLSGIGVYPRVCGGTATPRPKCLGSDGLSPRVRGNRPHVVAAYRWPGSIPACVGEPLQTGEPHSGAEVYPRVCGGTGFNHTAGPNERGLSPRMRGNRIEVNPEYCAARSIPAYAGEPCNLNRLSYRRQVYPRVCGGTADVAYAAIGRMGLSPRMRGNPNAPVPEQRHRGSIPAYAGEPAALELPHTNGWVYPRVCGGTRL